DDARFARIGSGSKTRLLVGEELVGNVREGITARQHLAGFQVALLAHLPPFIGAEGYGFIVVLRIRGRLTHAASGCVDVGHPPCFAVFPPVQPVTLSLLW